MSDTTVVATTYTRSEFELLVRETVHREIEQLLRQIVREELAYLLKEHIPLVAGNGAYEDPDDDPQGDAELLADVLAQIEREKTTPTPRIPWAEVKAELARAEAAGELPD